MKTIKRFNIGSELDKQIYKEGDNTWGCKSGWLDVEDVKDFIQELKEQSLIFLATEDYEKKFNKLLDKLAGDKLI